MDIEGTCRNWKESNTQISRQREGDTYAIEGNTNGILKMNERNMKGIRNKYDKGI